MIGSVVKCRQTGEQSWVVHQLAPDGFRLVLRSKETYEHVGIRQRITERTVGLGDCTVIWCRVSELA